MLGSLIGGALGLIGAKRTSDASAKAASTNREWQEELSNTAHQRQVKDLKKAGLNPILSAGGSGASTPSGSMANVPDFASALSVGSGSGIAAEKAITEIDSVKQSTDLAKENTRIASAKAAIEEHKAKAVTGVSKGVSKGVKSTNKLIDRAMEKGWDIRTKKTNRKHKSPRKSNLNKVHKRNMMYDRVVPHPLIPYRRKR